MSKYTTEVRYICETIAGLDESVDGAGIEEVITKSLDGIFNKTWAIFDENYRTTLERKIIRHFYTREIGFETVGLWKFHLNNKLNEIMPYYNKLYELDAQKFNPLWDVSITKDHTGEGTSNRDTDNVHHDTIDGDTTISQTGTENVNFTHTQNETLDGTQVSNMNDTSVTDTNQSTVTDTHETSQHTLSDDRWDYYSDTPQGSVSRLDDLTYLTNATHDTDELSEQTTTDRHTTENVTGHSQTTDTNVQNVKTDNTTTTEQTDTRETENSKDIVNESVTQKDGTDNTDEKINTTNQYLEHVFGKQGTITYGRVVMDYLESLVNIDERIINDLEPLFMQLW